MMRRSGPTPLGRGSRWDARVKAAVIAALVLAAGCSKKATEQSAAPAPAPSASVKALPAPVASGLPGDEQRVSRLVNPNAEKAYVGRTGTVRGRILAKGDAPPDVPPELLRITEPKCEPARADYQKLFRVGPDGGLGDVFVAVTGYRGYVPAKKPSARVEARNCFWGTRTIGLTLGQNIEVFSKDSLSYVPDLLGAPRTAQLVATPGSSMAATLYPPSIGSYVLIDNLRLFMTADVLVVKYATFDVTNADGAFEISDIPLGAVTLSAMLPATGVTAQKRVELRDDKPLDVDLEIVFDAAAYERRRAASAAASSSAAPSSSGLAPKAAPSARPAAPH